MTGHVQKIQTERGMSTMPEQNRPSKRFLDYKCQPGETCCIAGEMNFSRIASKRSPEEMRVINERRRSRGYADLPPHCDATVVNAAVQILDPQHPTEFEKFISANVYQSKSNGRWCFQGVTKGDRLPTVYHIQEDGSYKPIQLDKEIANGTRVRLLMRCFSAKPNNGFALNAVIIDDKDFSYYESGADTDLAKYGILVKRNPANPETIPADEQTGYMEQTAANIAPPQAAPQTQAPQMAAPQPQATPQMQAPPTYPQPMNPPEPTPQPPRYDNNQYNGLPFSPEDGEIDYGQAYSMDEPPVYQDNSYTPPTYTGNTQGGIQMP